MGEEEEEGHHDRPAGPPPSASSRRGTAGWRMRRRWRIFSTRWRSLRRTTGTPSSCSTGPPRRPPRTQPPRPSTPSSALQPASEPLFADKLFVQWIFADNALPKNYGLGESLFWLPFDIQRIRFPKDGK